MSKKSEVSSTDVYTHLMSFIKKEDWDSARLSEQLKIPVASIRTMIGHATKNPNVYRRLSKLGFEDHQIPGWFARPGQGVEAKSAETTEQVQETPETPEQVQDPKKPQEAQKGVQGAGKPKGPIPQIQPLGDLSPQETAKKLALSADPADPALSGGKLDSSGGKLESLRSPGEGLDSLDSSGDPALTAEGLAGVFDHQRSVQKMLEAKGVMHLADGRHMRAVQLQNGTIAYEEVDISTLGLPEDDIGKNISTITAKELDIQMRTIVRKVGFNPTVFLGYAWAVSEGHFPREGDIGDFLNAAVKFFLKVAFGGEVAVLTGSKTIEEISGQPSYQNRRGVIPV